MPTPVTIDASEFFRKWKTWGLPAFAGILLPWQAAITRIELISNYFQPELNILASVVGPLVALVIFSALNGEGKPKKIKVGVISFVLFVGALFLCLLLTHTVGFIEYRSKWVQIAIWIFWFAAYITVFSAFAATAVASTVAILHDGRAQS